MMTQLMTQIGGAAGGRQIVDMTGIKGNYDASLEISLAEIIALARAAGANIPTPAPGGAGAAAISVAPDPGGGGSSVSDAVQSMGLKLESRKAMVDQFIVDYVEKMPSEN
jgi:uncharacterized protein (TIGR03435 family)